MGCFSCFRTSNELKKSWKCWKGKSSKEDVLTRKRKRRGFMCCLCGGRMKDEESLKNKASMCCFNCNKSSKDAKDEEPTRKRLKCGMGCFICGKSSEDKELLRKKGKGVCDKSSKDEKSSRKCGKCGMGCCTCDKSTKDEESSGKEGKCGTGCFSCHKSSKYEELSGKKGRCGMSCFTCDKSSKDEESSEKCGRCGMGCFTCDKSSKDEESLRKKGKCGMDCFCCSGSSNEEDQSQKGGKCGICFNGNKLSSEDPSRKKEEGCMSCFCCCKPSKKEEGSGKVGDKDTSSAPDGQPSRRKSARGVSCLCGCLHCFTCDMSSKDEESLRKKGKCGMDCFCCSGSSNEEDQSQKGGKCGICFNGNKLSSEDPSRKKEEGCMSCFCCCKPSKKEEGSGKVGDKDTSRAPDGEPSRRKSARGVSCLCGCLHCFSSRNKNASKPCRKMFCWKRKEKREINHLASLVKTISFKSGSSKKRSQAEEILRIGSGNIASRVFAYKDLVEATQNFAPQCLLGRGGFGKVYRGQLKCTNQMIAVKKLDRNGNQGNREFLVEVLMLSLLSHQNLVNLHGYCAEGGERILVYEYMSLGSLQDHLFDLSPNTKPLDWNTRMKIAAGAARGLEHLHDTANPPVIYRDLKASNILLDEHYNPRLADFGLAKVGPVGDKNHVSTRVMGTFGYCAPEYALTGKLTTMSDIYSFGVVLLELITGRKAMDSTRPRNEQRLVDWVTPRFQDRKNFVQLADPLLEGSFPAKSMYQALAVATMCLQEEDTTRPLIKDVLFALQFLAMPEKSTVANKHPTEPPREIYSTSTDDWLSCSDHEQEEEKLINQEADVTRDRDSRNADPRTMKIKLVGAMSPVT